MPAYVNKLLISLLASVVVQEYFFLQTGRETWKTDLVMGSNEPRHEKTSLTSLRGFRPGLNCTATEAG